MYVGYISIGADDPFAQPASESVEVINNPRAYAYARHFGLDWVQECDDCPDVAKVVPGGPDFVSPTADPAPWYDPDDPDTWGFCGVIGLEVVGAQDSTRRVNVSMALTGIGVIGPTYMAPRTMTVRALAIASDDCSLNRGIQWLREQYNVTTNPCGGDPMTYFDCCPCICDDDEGMGGPCWVHNYTQLRSGPTDCTPDWWPTTYQELRVGPPDDDEDWCAWPRIYRELRTGPPAWSCCIDACLVPYMRQFHNTRVTAGPAILRKPEMSCGAFAEIELTIVAADPKPHSMPFTTAAALITADTTEIIDDDVTMPAVADDPFAAVA